MEQALFDLEATNTELKADLRDLYITSAREIDIRDSTRKAIIVHVSGGANSALLRGGEKWQPTPTAGRVTHKTAIKLALNLALSLSLHRAQVPYRLLKAFHKIQQRLVRELEKKFSGKDVVLIANRRILPPSSTGKATDRPRSRTLTAVRHACLHGGVRVMRDLQHSEAAASSQWCMQCMQMLPYGGCRIIRGVPRAASGRPSGQQALSRRGGAVEAASAGTCWTGRKGIRIRNKQHRKWD